MKRYNNLYEKIYDYHNVVQAHHMARIGKAHYRGVKMVNRDEFNYCVKISEMLYKQTYIVNKDSYNLKCKYFQPLIGKKYYDHNGDIQILDLKLF